MRRVGSLRRFRGKLKIRRQAERKDGDPHDSMHTGRNAAAMLKAGENRETLEGTANVKSATDA
jgi:hypothetical protein